MLSLPQRSKLYGGVANFRFCAPQQEPETDTDLPRSRCIIALDVNLEAALTERDYDLKLEELERILNDPEVAMEPAKVWSLLAEVSQHDQVRPL